MASLVDVRNSDSKLEGPILRFSSATNSHEASSNTLEALWPSGSVYRMGKRVSEVVTMFRGSVTPSTGTEGIPAGSCLSQGCVIHWALRGAEGFLSEGDRGMPAVQGI